MQAVRGPGGGYQLARAACDISVADIVAAVDDEPDGRKSDLKSYGDWPSLSQALAACLASVSLQVLADEQPEAMVHEPNGDASVALRRGISTQPVLQPIVPPAYSNSVFSLAEALK